MEQSNINSLPIEFFCNSNGSVIESSMHGMDIRRYRCSFESSSIRSNYIKIERTFIGKLCLFVRRDVPTLKLKDSIMFYYVGCYGVKNFLLCNNSGNNSDFRIIEEEDIRFLNNKPDNLELVKVYVDIIVSETTRTKEEVLGDLTETQKLYYLLNYQ